MVVRLEQDLQENGVRNITYQHDIVCSPKRMPERTRE